jgi:hypothetical protein
VDELERDPMGHSNDTRTTSVIIGERKYVEAGLSANPGHGQH